MPWGEGAPSGGAGLELKGPVCTHGFNIDSQLHGRWISETGQFTQKGCVDVLLCAASARTWLQKQNNAGEFHVHNSGVASSVAMETDCPAAVKAQHCGERTGVSLPRFTCRWPSCQEWR